MLILTSIFYLLARAQHNAPPPPASSSSTPVTTSVPFATSLSPAALSSAAGPYAPLPTFTDSTTPTVVPNNGTAERSVLNYYFLLLAVFIVVIIVLYWVLLRKRKRRFAEATTRRQNSLAFDLGQWPGNGRDRRGGVDTTRTGRWHVLRPTRPQEGLNERGEAPPAYVAKPVPSHPTPSAGSIPPESIETAGKPPDYEETRHT